MRLHFRLGITPTPKLPLPSVRAQGDEDAGTRWTGTSLDLKTLLAAASLLVTVVGFRVSTQTSLVEIRAGQEAERTARAEDVAKLAERVTNLERGTVGRNEIEKGFANVAQRQTFAEQQVQQLYTLQLTGRLRP